MLSRLDDHLLGIPVHRLARPATEEVLESIWPGPDSAANAFDLLCGQRHVQRVAVHEGDPSPVLEALDGIPCTKNPSRRPLLVLPDNVSVTELPSLRHSEMPPLPISLCKGLSVQTPCSPFTAMCTSCLRPPRPACAGIRDYGI